LYFLEILPANITFAFPRKEQEKLRKFSLKLTNDDFSLSFLQKWENLSKLAEKQPFFVYVLMT
jgi:hypothetical protein